MYVSKSSKGCSTCIHVFNKNKQNTYIKSQIIKAVKNCLVYKLACWV